MANEWFFELDNTIFSYIKTLGEESLPGVFFTDDALNMSPAKLPCVHFHAMPGTENGMELDGTDIVSVLYSAQVDVYSELNQQDARRIMNSIVAMFKQIRFSIISTPEINPTSSGVYRATARFRRLIGSGDKL